MKLTDKMAYRMSIKEIMLMLTVKNYERYIKDCLLDDDFNSLTQDDLVEAIKIIKEEVNEDIPYDFLGSSKVTWFLLMLKGIIIFKFIILIAKMRKIAEEAEKES